MTQNNSAEKFVRLFRNSIFLGVSKVGQTTETYDLEKRLATLPPAPSKIHTWLLSKISLNNQVSGNSEIKAMTSSQK